MDEHHAIYAAMMQIVGVILMLCLLADIFLTVLYARMGTTLLSGYLGRTTWRIFRSAATPFPSRRGTILSFCGPAMMLILFSFWAVGLTVGAGLIIYPALGTEIQSSGGGPMPHDFVTALYAAANSLSIVGAGSYSAKTTGFKLIYMFNSLVGLCGISLTLTYLMQVYSALRTRNSAALRAYLATGETGDAVEFVAGLGPNGDFNNAASRLANMAEGIADVKETHHFYGMLIYFRFPEPYYAVTSLAGIALDTVSLIKSALDDEQFATLKESAAVQDLWHASQRLLGVVADGILPGGRPSKDPPPPPDAATRERWLRRYRAALQRLKEARIRTLVDQESGFRIYVALRNQWEPDANRLAQAMLYEPMDLDPAGSRPEDATDERPDFRARLHSAG
jgi:hypothetical protein